MSNPVRTLPERKDIAIDDTWDLTPLYQQTDDWEDDFQSINAKLDEITGYQGKLGEGPAVLAEMLVKMDGLDRLLEKIYTYAHLRSDEDVGNSINLGRLNRITTKFAEVRGKAAWIEPEILAIPEATMDSFLEAQELSFYRRSLEELLRKRTHTLSAPEERILGMAADALSTPSKAFSALNNADMRFPSIEDENGDMVEVTHGNYIKHLESAKRDVRQAAFGAMYDTVKSYRNTFCATLDGAVKTHILNAQLRSFPSALAAALHPDNVPVDVYNNLISTVHDNLSLLHQYFGLRAKVLKLDKLDMWDIYTPLVSEYKVEVPWAEACDWVKAAVAPLGSDYSEILGKALTDRWIDVQECRGKRSGAYSSGCYDSPPYVLMNYNGTLNHAFTLAHELGHSLHSYYSKQAQDYHYAHYRIFVAEVASTTNELLLHDHLMKTAADPKFKTYLLNHLAEQIRGTVFRQTKFAEFERDIHQLSESGQPLTADELSSRYYNLNATYHGDSVVPDQRIEMEWARIPHFYYNFYVYKYATGFSAAVQLSRNILTGSADDLARYMQFLQAGDTKDVLEIMKDAGVDLSQPAPIEATMALFEETVNELENLL